MSPALDHPKGGKDTDPQKRPFHHEFAGIQNGSFWNGPDWVDQTLPPGHTSQIKLIGVGDTLKAIFSLK
jgi:hypothetical protein